MTNFVAQYSNFGGTSCVFKRSNCPIGNVQVTGWSFTIPLGSTITNITVTSYRSTNNPIASIFDDTISLLNLTFTVTNPVTSYWGTADFVRTSFAGGQWSAASVNSVKM